MSFANDDRLYLERWDELPENEQAGIGHDLQAQLGDSYRFVELVPCQFAGQSRQVARLVWQPDAKTAVEFHLIPGATVTLGVDTAKPLPIHGDTANARTWADFLDTWHQARIGCAMPTEVQERLFTPLRTVTLAPFLAERTACRVRKGLARDGLRMPTSDEWEYACGAGARTVFRWSNELPPHMPARHGFLSDREVDEAAVAQQIEMRPNSFGLQIGYDPYERECVSNPTAMRGGDGGNAICGADGWFAIWISLASAWIHPGRSTGATRRCRSLP